VTGRLDPPPGYDDERRTIWADVIDRLTAAGQLFRADPDTVDAYVQAVRSHRQATRLLDNTSVLISHGDRAVENPALAVQRRQGETIARLARALGLRRGPGTLNVPAAPPAPVGGARWCTVHERPECTHHKRKCSHRKDQPPPAAGCCHEQAVKGTGACYHHAGVSLADQRRRGASALLRLYASPLEIGPAEGLLDEVRWSAGHVAALRAEVQRLAADGPGQTAADGDRQGQTGAGGGLFWGAAKVTVRDGELAEVVEQAGPHAVLAAYDAERAHFARVCKAALDAGAQQQAIDLARILGADVGRLIDAVIARLDLTPGQRALVPVVVPEVLRSWTPAAGTGP
jgi:hypothetical protein